VRDASWSKKDDLLREEYIFPLKSSDIGIDQLKMPSFGSVKFLLSVEMGFFLYFPKYSWCFATRWTAQLAMLNGLGSVPNLLWVYALSPNFCSWRIKTNEIPPFLGANLINNYRFVNKSITSRKILAQKIILKGKINKQLTLSHMAYEVLFTILQGGQLSIPLKTTLAKVKTILGAVYTLAMICSIMYAPCCQTLICSN